MDTGITCRGIAAGIAAGFRADAARAQAQDDIAIVVGDVVDEPHSWTVADLEAVPTVDVSPNRTEGNSRPETARGPLLYDVLMASQPPDVRRGPGRFVVLATGEDGFVPWVAWAEIDPALEGQQAIVSIESDGIPLAEDVGPACSIVPEDCRVEHSAFKLRRSHAIDTATWLAWFATPTANTAAAILRWDAATLSSTRPGWRNGRRASLRSWWPQGRAGSTPAPGTTRTRFRPGQAG